MEAPLDTCSRPGQTRHAEVVVRGVAAGGDGIGRLADGRVVFCEGGLPGERVAVAIVGERRDFARGRVIEVLDASPMRVRPPCPELARGCGGCTWQHVRPADAGTLKVAIVADALRRLAHIEDVTVHASRPGRPGVPVVGHRTSLRLAVDGDGRPAYRRRHTHDLVPVVSCLVAHPRLAELVVDSRFPGARHVGLRVGGRTGDRLATPDRAAGAASVPDGTLVADARDANAFVHESVGGRRWRISASSFFQSGPEAAEALAAAVEAAARISGAGATIVDLYAGVGLLGGLLAARTDAASVVAVEAHPDACRDAAVNLADFDARVVSAEVAALPASAPGAAPPDVVIADPARGGLGPSAARAVRALGAPVLVVAGCDPASFARDAGLLSGLGYRLESVEVLDLFPATFHAEAVGRFTLGACSGARAASPGCRP